jgi:hypothetical protein
MKENDAEIEKWAYQLTKKKDCAGLKVLVRDMLHRIITLKRENERLIEKIDTIFSTHNGGLK